MELLDGLISFVGTGELDKGKPARLAGHFIEHDIDGSHDASLRKIILKIILHRLVREVAYKQPGWIHRYDLSDQKTKWEDCTGRITECRLRFTDNLSSDTSTVCSLNRQRYL